jgi:N-acetylglucosamine-6-phosphate deacetylase
VVTPTQVLPDAIVEINNGTVTAVTPADGLPLPEATGDTNGTTTPEPTALTILPGLVDIHNHGGGGSSFADALTAEDVSHAAGEHLRHGTTTIMASLVTADRPTLLARAELLAAAVDAGIIAGIHAEGPFLSPQRCGAQNPADLTAADPGFVTELLQAARGHLRTMTLAPEVAGVTCCGGVAVALAEGGVIPSLGHTNATFGECEAMIARTAPLLAEHGLRMTATHLFNGMPPIHHRNPGPVMACLAAAARGEMVVELIADGVHLDPSMMRTVMELVSAENMALVTDAMAATGMADGAYRLGPADVVVTHGVARLATTDGSLGALAGGTAHLLDTVRTCVNAGVPLIDAVNAASATPAGALGWTDRGGIAPGKRADILVTNRALKPVQVYRAGILQ